MKETYQEEKTQRYHRRFFLVNGLTYLAGTLFGLNLFSMAEANERRIRSMPKPRRQGTSFSAPASRIALIIDDIGHSVTRARAFLSLNMPMTFSILPQLRHSKRLAEEITGKGHEVMLHQPMEPYCNEIHPGPGAVYISYENRKIEETIEQNLSQIPQATGVNNHMGSRFTSCSSKVFQALKIIKKKDLFFVDSLTSSHSQAYQMARRLNMRTAPRNVFLDHTPDIQA
ncbi:MAG: divergent polysaccharide deacetylase family protein, partial [Desulfobacterales bacterium]